MPTSYQRACNYAHVIHYDSETSRDLVHNAFLQYYDLTDGKNLFDEPLPYIFGCVKKAHQRAYRSNQYMHKGELITREYKSIEDLEIELEHFIDESEQDKIIKKDSEQENINFIKQLKKEVGEYKTEGYKANHKLNPEILSSVLEQMIDGSGVNKIAEDMNMSTARISGYKTKIKTIAKSMKDKSSAWQNPFNASNIKVTKIITLNQWERRTDKEDYTLDGFCQNEYYEIQVHNESGDGILVKLPPSKINPSI